MSERSIQFDGLLVNGQTGGEHSATFARTLLRIELATTGVNPASADLKVQVRLAGVANAAIFTLPAGLKYAENLASGSGIAIAANVIEDWIITTAAGASDLVVTATYSESLAAGAGAPYIAIGDIAGDIPQEFLIEALDDDSDGTADAGAWDNLYASVANDVDGILSAGGLTLPLTAPYAPAVIKAAKMFALEKLYNRRGVTGDERNPWSAKAKDAREKLKDWISTQKFASWGSDDPIDL
jgi:hypothetical protein